MKLNLFLLLAVSFSLCGSLSLCGCDGNPSPPAIQAMSLNVGRVNPGSDVILSISYRDGATKTEGTLRSDPFSSVVSIPAGATYVPHSSAILFDSLRPPDAEGICPDGRSYLLYNFRAGELTVPDGFDPFIAVLNLHFILQLPANGQRIIASAEPTPPDDPCGPISGDDVTLSVRS